MEYAEERWGMLLEEDRALARERGWEAAIREVGIAGIDSEVDPGNIKCLHTHYAHWLGRGGAGNLVGEWVHERLGET